jgi:GTP-binding protein
VKFIDEVLIQVSAGNGGPGCVSFRREKYIPKGGPDGGDGGKGGDVVFHITSQKRTLSHFQYQKKFIAKKGGHGQGSQRTGKSGPDLVIELPVGTLVYNSDTNQLIRDCVSDNEYFVIARGGIGGKGNKHFATSTHRTPRFAQPGMEGETFQLRLELKLLADVGIIGLPNAGKSTLISQISSAKSKIADYPFTTLNPILGVVTPKWGEPFIVADIPGLIEGAHEGAGLGIRFLKHIERTRTLLHLIDASTIDPSDPLKQYNTINRELAGFNPELAQKPQIVVLNKMDIPESDHLAEAFIRKLKKISVHKISAATGNGVKELMAEVNKKYLSGIF